MKRKTKAELEKELRVLQRRVKKLEARDAKLEEVEERYRSTLDNMMEGCQIIGRDWTYLYVNDAIARHGRRSKEELLGRTMMEMYPGIDKTEMFSHLRRCMEERVPHRMENEFAFPDGSRGWFELSIEPVPEGVFILSIEITERKRTEEALRKTHRALMTLSESNQALVRATDEKKLLTEICRIIVEVGEYRLAWVGFAEDAENKTVRPVAQAGYEDGYLDTVDITWADTERGRGPTGRAIRTGEPSIARHIPTDPDYAPWREQALKRGYASSIALPLIAGQKPLGALNIYAPEPDAFGEEEVRLLTEMADDLAYGITALRTRAEHARVEKALLKAAEEWRATFDAIGDAVCLLDAEGEVIRCNKAMAKFLGRPFQEIVGRRCYELVHDAGERVAGCPFLRMKETRRRESVDLEIRGRWYEVAVDPLLDDSGNVKAAVHILADITERRQAEETVRESEERYRDLVENTNDMVQSVAPNGSYIYVNRAWRETLGYGEDEVRNLSLFDVIHPDSRERCREIFRRVLAGEKVGGIEVEFVTKDGRTVSAEGSANCRFVDGEPVATRGMFRDVTGRKRAEEARRESEERYRDLVEGISDLVQSVAPDGSLVFVNRAWQEALGYSEEELAELSLFDVIHPESREHCMEAFKRVLAGERLTNVEAKFLAKDGRTVEVAGSASCRFVDGKPVATYSIFRDVTERRRAERETRVLQAQFLQAQKMEAVGRLAGGVAHDFNNLMMVVTGYSELALKDMDESDPLRKDLEAMKRAGERASTLTRQLLAFSRRQVLQPKVLDLNAVVTDMEKMLPRLIGEDIELVTVFGENLGRIKADPGQVEQVMMNLAVNARDAMPKGGKLIIETANVDLDEECARRHVGVRPGPYVRLAVSDTGSGMEEDTLSHIFEPFFTTKEEGRGTGLGLATVYGIVEQHEGHVWAYSEPGRGTTFKIHLPRLEEGVEGRGIEALPGEIPRGTETVLVVEDEEVVRAVACKMLALGGYKVLEARSGSEALEICRRHEGPMHLLMTDVVMPGMGGRELAERAASLCPGLKVLYMSGYTNNAIAHHGVLEPGVAFIEKPFTPDALARKVREVLDAPQQGGDA